MTTELHPPALADVAPGGDDAPAPPQAARPMSALERRITIAAVVLPFAGTIAAVWLSWQRMVTVRDLAIFAVMYAVTGFGITVGYHRMLTHRSFQAPAAVRAAFAIAGSMAVQGAVIHWVADHRKHHTFPDEDGDPHSPHLVDGHGWRRVVRGLWHAHMGWLFDRADRASARRYARDLRTDPLIAFIDRWFPLWALLGLALPFALGVAFGGTLAAGLTALVWGGFVRIFLVHHATWSVNSICHMYGSRPFALEDESRNNGLVGLVALGEGWHHNHHAFPTSARHGLRPRQIDPSFALIRLLAAARLAHDVTTPDDAAIARKLRAGGGAPAPHR